MDDMEVGQVDGVSVRANVPPQMAVRVEQPEREVTPLIQHMADLYNKASPVEQRRLDLRLQQKRAALVANPAAVFHLFPSLGTKTLKLKGQP